MALQENIHDDDFQDIEPGGQPRRDPALAREGEDFLPTGTSGTESSQPEVETGPTQTPEEIKAAEETKTQVRDIISTNLTDPTLPDAAQQEVIKLADIMDLDPEEFKLGVSPPTTTAVPSAVSSVTAGQITSKEVTAELAKTPEEIEVERGVTTQLPAPDIARYDEMKAALLNPNSTPEVRAVAIAGIREIEAQKAIMTAPAEWVKGTVNPEDLAKVITMDIPEKAYVKGQLDSLLGELANGEVPAWAQPAVAQAEAMLAGRGMALSNIGQQGMFNAIISAAMPIAQADAKARMSIFSQELSQAQQTELSNSKVFQTMNLTNLSNEQQAAMLNATNQAQFDITNADRAQLAMTDNAKLYLQMDIANQSAEMQAATINAQLVQQTLLANQSAFNVAAQINATNSLQANQFNSNLKASIDINNAGRSDAMSQFSAQASNEMSRLDAQLKQQTELANAAASDLANQFNSANQLKAEQANAALKATVETQNAEREATMNRFLTGEDNAMAKFNTQTEQQRNMFNTQNAIAIEQNNLQWRRQANQIDTAAENAINQANAMNSLSLSNQSLAFLWNEMRDNAKMQWEGVERADDRKHQLAIAALGNEQAASEDKYGLWKTVGSFAYDLFKDND